jgi:hypothetical protein
VHVEAEDSAPLGPDWEKEVEQPGRAAGLPVPTLVLRVGFGQSIVPALLKPFDPVQLAEVVQLALEHPVRRV